ncbi:AraC family transcriptional regulator [Rhizobium jaguaris]|uniref:AraC family transcriptional regulator n=1 Tax=Rhizobium jaguaris TaxID=1312183 RepID=UPI001FDFBC71|nr:AraC family transcriptional regulator [Rhizobium jaguaris]
MNLDCPETVTGSTGEAGIVLGLQRQEPALDRVKLGEYFIPVIPFPHGTIGLASLILDPPGKMRREETTSIYLSRRTFDQIADTLGTDRIVELPLAPGIATGDTVIENLFSCLIPAIEQPGRTSALFIDHVGKAFNAHIAQHYGRMQMVRPAVIGGLTPWQLRRARDTINARLDQDVSLAQLASDCGLSTSHFARAFARSTGIPPHRWVMQRRVDRAKELMRTGTPLAEIALMCGFSDQSHLTRVFFAIRRPHAGTMAGIADINRFRCGAGRNERGRSVLTTGKGPLLDRRYGIKSPLTLISTLAGSESRT